MDITDYDEIDRLYPLASSELPRQFILTQDSHAVPADWDSETLKDWHFAAHPSTTILSLFSQGTPVGWILQPLAYLSDRGDEICNSLMDIADLQSAEAIERFLYGRNSEKPSRGSGLVGCWTAIILTDNVKRVYTSGGQSAVYSQTERTVAATTNLIPRLKRDKTLSKAFDPLSKNSFYTFGLTPFRGVRRLLPNHYLELDRFEEERHWPTSGIAELSATECVEAISNHAKRVFEILSRAYPTLKIYLSAGNDSRAVLALTRHLDRQNTGIILETSFGEDFFSQVDRQAAIRLAKIAGLKLTLRRRKPFRSETETVRNNFIRIGEGHGGKSLGIAGLTRPDKAPSFKLGGAGGEAGRAFYYKSGELPTTVGPDFLVKTLHSPSIPQVTENARRWLSSLPAEVRNDPALVLDLLYLEQRMGCWSAPGTYLYDGSRQVENVFQEAPIIEMMLQLPKSYRVSGRLQQDIVAYCWPELMKIPINQRSGILWKNGARMVLRRIRSFIRQLAPNS